jgi:serine/threonine protein kinase
MLSPGAILQERYLIDRKLGEGGMGAVYAAIDERFGTPIALKEVIFDAVNKEQRENVTAAFEREAKSLAKARHEAIPFVRDYFSEGGRQFLVMELIEGDDLAELLQKNRQPFPLDRIVDWMRQLLDSLDYLHSLDPPIIHRDIKPQNLKVTSRGRLKLLDFGIAKSSESSAVNSITKTFAGATLTYSPIEQILRVIDPMFREFIILKYEARAKAVLAQNTDCRADVFAVGGTFYHLLTDHVPEEATKRTLEVWEGKPDPLQHPSDLNPALPRVFGDFLLEAMAIDRDSRYPSAGEMIGAMDRALRQPRPATSTADFETLPLLEVPTEQKVPSVAAPTVNSAGIEPAGLRTQPLISNVELPRSAAATDWSRPDISPLRGETIANSIHRIETKNQATVPERPAISEDKARPKTIYWVVLAVAAAGLFVIVVAGGGVVLMNGFGRAANTNTTLNRPAATPQATPTLAPTPLPSPTAQVFVSPTPVPTVMPDDRQDVATRKQNVKKTPTPQHARSGKKPSQDLNCVYTNSCH